MEETIYQVYVYRHGSKCGVVHNFSDFDVARKYYARKLKQGVDAGYHFDVDMYACHYDSELQGLLCDACVATFTWDFDR